jgi:hypothetical protein
MTDDGTAIYPLPPALSGAVSKARRGGRGCAAAGVGAGQWGGRGGGGDGGLTSGGAYRGGLTLKRTVSPRGT